MYDREREKVGFWKTNCSELWERLQAIAPPPPDRTNLDGSPTMAPAQPPHISPGMISW